LLPSVVGGASLYPAVQNLLLACRAEGLGCVLTTLLCQAEAKIGPLLELPEPWGTAAFVPIGFSERFGQAL
jgi:nitroreductase